VSQLSMQCTSSVTTVEIQCTSSVTVVDAVHK